jgi:hypothetical protein
VRKAQVVASFRALQIGFRERRSFQEDEKTREEEEKETFVPFFSRLI